MESDKKNCKEKYRNFISYAYTLCFDYSLFLSVQAFFRYLENLFLARGKRVLTSTEKDEKYIQNAEDGIYERGADDNFFLESREWFDQ